MTALNGAPGLAQDREQDIGGLASLPGLETVAGQLGERIAVLRAEQARRQAGVAIKRPAWKNLVLTGGPGTGKSRTARAVARVYPELGLLSSGHVALRLPADGGVTGTVVITAAALPGAVLAQFTVSAVITGGTPGTFYDLIGNDCPAASPLGDHVWATGLTSANGTADLVGYAWTGAVTDFYWLALDPSPASRPAGLHGLFTQGQAAPFPAGQAPCAPSP